MRIGRIVHTRRKLLSWGVLVVLAATVGCSGDTGGGGPPDADVKAIQDADRDARQKAYGGTGVGTKTAPKQ